MLQSDLKILIIDDNPAIHKDFIKILTRSQKQNEFAKLDQALFDVQPNENPLPLFQIDTVSQGEEGVKQIQNALQQKHPYALAFVDIRMPPGLDGVQTTKRIWEIDPNIQIVICTAYSDYSWEETVSELGHKDNLLILKKPFDTVAVRQLACALTKKWLLLQENKAHMQTLEDKIKERTLSLEKSLTLTRATIESTADGILVVDDTGKIVNYNSRFVSMWNILPIVLELKEWNIVLEYLLSQLNNPSNFLKEVKRLNKHPDSTGINEVNFKNQRVYEYYSQPYHLKDKVVGRVWSFRDITKRVGLEKELQYRATHDELTGLPNRLEIMEMIYPILSKNKDNHVAILFIDLDRFKLINDSLGHAAGDRLVKEFADRLKNKCDENHVPSRIGGDEFIILIKKIKDKQEVIEFATRLIDMTKEAFIIDNHQIFINASIGISISSTDGESAEELLQHADTAMYHGKACGGNQIQLYRPGLDEQSLRRLEAETELRQAITDQQFLLCYQPEIDVLTGKLKALEVLIRWQHPTKGLILPMDFIPLAEETGLIVAIGEWVLRVACTQNKKWQNAGLPPVKIAVNVTAAQFKQPDFISTVKHILQETQLDPKYLEIEVTENTIVSDPLIINVIQSLKNLGITIMLDDFGTGYSSLAYLKNLPLDGLKIDKSFIQNITRDYGDEIIIRAIISMAHNLNLDVVAEGVELPTQLLFLKQERCVDVQGFYFSEPVSADKIESILKKSKF